MAASEWHLPKYSCVLRGEIVYVAPQKQVGAARPTELFEVAHFWTEHMWKVVKTTKNHAHLRSVFADPRCYDAKGLPAQVSHQASSLHSILQTIT